ncbi:MAG TPA: hypothetical protein VHA74_00570, partial [Candidatus Dojkabacteria bacterium]|nr:hypothetical protein [Candidatus Dojkabacteria bacterium]
DKNEYPSILDQRKIDGRSAMPLPVFITLLGYVTYNGLYTQDNDVDPTKLKSEYENNIITLDIGQSLELLKRITKGRVKLGSRLVRDRFFHTQFKTKDPTMEDIDYMYSGPMLPTDMSDEMSIADLQRFLISLYGETHSERGERIMRSIYNNVLSLTKDENKDI